MSWSCQLVISIFTLKPHSKSRRDNCSGTIPLSSCNLGSKTGFYYSQRNRLQPILHQTLHRHTEELLVAQWSSLPKWIKAAKEQVGGSRGENPRTGVWSRAAPNSLCYTNRAIPCVKALHNVTTACLCSHTERRDCSHKYENSKGLYNLLPPWFFMFSFSHMTWSQITLLFLWMGTVSIHGFWTHGRLLSNWTNLHRAPQD